MTIRSENPYRAALERELGDLTRRTIGLRGLLRRGPHAFSGDSLDKLRGMERAAEELAFAEREKARVRHLLGMPEPVGAIKLDAPIASRAAHRGAVSIAPARATRTVPGGILTRMINGPGCR